MHRDGSLTAVHHQHGGRVVLPVGYVATQVELGYATTTHRAQRATVDTAHALVGESSTREQLYVAATRARHRTTLYLTTADLLDPHHDHTPAAQLDQTRAILTCALHSSGAEASATETLRAALNATTRRASPQLSVAPALPSTQRTGPPRSHAVNAARW